VPTKPDPEAPEVTGAEDSLGFDNGERDELYCVNGNGDSQGARFVLPRRRDPDVASTRAASALSSRAFYQTSREIFEISFHSKSVTSTFAAETA
jgi:hypothetical protein